MYVRSHHLTQKSRSFISSCWTSPSISSMSLQVVYLLDILKPVVLSELTQGICHELTHYQKEKLRICNHNRLQFQVLQPREVASRVTTKLELKVQVTVKISRVQMENNRGRSPIQTIHMDLLDFRIP